MFWVTTASIRRSPTGPRGPVGEIGVGIEDAGLLAHLPGATPGVGVLHEAAVGELGGIDPGPHPIGAPEVGDPRLGGDAGPGEDEDAFLPVEQSCGGLDACLAAARFEGESIHDADGRSG